MQDLHSAAWGLHMERSAMPLRCRAGLLTSLKPVQKAAANVATEQRMDCLDRAHLGRPKQQDKLLEDMSPMWLRQRRTAPVHLEVLLAKLIFSSLKGGRLCYHQHRSALQLLSLSNQRSHLD